MNNAFVWVPHKRFPARTPAQLRLGGNHPYLLASCSLPHRSPPRRACYLRAARFHGRIDAVNDLIESWHTSLGHLGEDGPAVVEHLERARGLQVLRDGARDEPNAQSEDGPLVGDIIKNLRDGHAQVREGLRTQKERADAGKAKPARERREVLTHRGDRVVGQHDLEVGVLLLADLLDLEGSPLVGSGCAKGDVQPVSEARGVHVLRHGTQVHGGRRNARRGGGVGCGRRCRGLEALGVNRRVRRRRNSCRGLLASRTPPPIQQLSAQQKEDADGNHRQVPVEPWRGRLRRGCSSRRHLLGYRAPDGPFDVDSSLGLFGLPNPPPAANKIGEPHRLSRETTCSGAVCVLCLLRTETRVDGPSFEGRVRADFRRTDAARPIQAETRAPE